MQQPGLTSRVQTVGHPVADALVLHTLQSAGRARGGVRRTHAVAGEQVDVVECDERAVSEGFRLRICYCSSNVRLELHEHWVIVSVCVRGQFDLEQLPVVVIVTLWRDSSGAVLDGHRIRCINSTRRNCEGTCIERKLNKLLYKVQFNINYLYLFIT